jgi:hypothetical protein
VDDVVRSGRLVLTVALVAPAPIVACLGAIDGCAGRGNDLVGISSPRAAERPPPQGASDAMSPVPADFRVRLTPIRGRFLSEGHGSQFEAVLWANDAARAGAPGGDFAEGAMLVEELLARGAPDGGGAEGLLVLEKHAEGWRFAAVGPDGDTVNDARVEPCKTCHREAPRDFVFPMPGVHYSSSADASAATTTIAPTTVATPAATYDARSAGSADAPSSR